MSRTVILSSGGFDPLHPGHVEYLEQAKMLASDSLHIVALNSDAWLLRKKGYRMMPFEDRCRILLALKCVDQVYQVDDSDGSVCQRWGACGVTTPCSTVMATFKSRC
jgi:cytidyltransferase-like protein